MKLILLSFLLIDFTVYANDISLTEVRALFEHSATNKDSCIKLISDLNDYDELNNPTLAAYKASALLMNAKYLVNPIAKLNSFKRGKELLEKCIETDYSNVEARYLRFTIQSNLPLFLNYNNSITQDKVFLLDVFNKLNDMHLKEMIVSFLKTSEYVTIKEKQKLKS